jgi:amidohydrolase
VLIRGDIDALPIEETSKHVYNSVSHGVMHACGHDGHTSMVTGLAMHLAEYPPAGFRVVCLFQPAEENGKGARAVVRDPQYADLRPDAAFALHNYPGDVMGAVRVRSGCMMMASCGTEITWEGRTSHAAEPWAASPAAVALSEALRLLPIGPAAAEDLSFVGDSGKMTTVTHASLGEPTFGITPGSARILSTSRASTDALLDAEMQRVVGIAQRATKFAKGGAHSSAGALSVSIEQHEAFTSTHNDKIAAHLVTKAALGRSLDVIQQEYPILWSEDFGVILRDMRRNNEHAWGGAMFTLGSGEEQQTLHHPEYDFPDGLLELGVPLWCDIVAKAGSALLAR